MSIFVKKGVLCTLVVALSLMLFSCATSNEQLPVKIQAKTEFAEASEEQERYLILFSNMRIRDIQELQGFFNAIDYLCENNDPKAREYLAGYGDALLSDCYNSSYYAFLETFSQKTMQEILGKNLCAAFSREGEARRAFIDQVRSNPLSPSLMDPKSEFHALMVRVEDTYKNLIPYNVYLVRIGQSKEEDAQYCSALEKFSNLLKEATELLRADENETF